MRVAARPATTRPAELRSTDTPAVDAVDPRVVTADAEASSDARGDEPPTVSSDAATVAPPSEHPRVYRGMAEDDWVTAMATRPVVRVVRRYSSSTFVYQLELEGGMQIAFKPDRVGQEGWWRHEVIAYRLARLIDIRERVPPAVVRRVPLAVLGRLGRGAGLVPSGRHRDVVVGAAIAWVPELHYVGLHTPDAMHRWNAWLRPGAAIPPEHDARAREIAEVLVLDFLAANSDRWNSANLPTDENGHLVFRDNNGGWFLSELQRQGWIESIRRIPRGVFQAIERATPESFAAELLLDAGGEAALLARPNLAAWETRRARLVDRIRSLVRRHGADAVFAWP